MYDAVKFFIYCCIAYINQQCWKQGRGNSSVQGRGAYIPYLYHSMIVCVFMNSSKNDSNSSPHTHMKVLYELLLFSFNLRVDSVHKVYTSYCQSCILLVTCSRSSALVFVSGTHISIHIVSGEFNLQCTPDKPIPDNPTYQIFLPYFHSTANVHI